MKFKCYGTGSKGNHYVLTSDSGEKLVIELGLPFRTILPNFDFSNTRGILISHNHNDHNYDDYNKTKIVSRFDNFASIKVLQPRNIVVGKEYKIGNSFKVVPIEAFHNVDCYSFLIKCDDKIIYFATDTSKLTIFNNVKIDIMICEVNHSQELLKKTVDEDEEGIYKHLITSFQNHLALEKVENYLEHLEYKVKEFYAIHWSRTPAFNEKDIIKSLEKYCDKVKVVKDGDLFTL